MAAKAKGTGGIRGEHVLFALLIAVAFKFAVDELSMAAEHGFENWRRHRLGW